METPSNSPKVESAPNILWWILISVSILILIISGVISCDRDKKEKVENTEQTNNSTTLPSVYIKYYTLSPGDTILVEIRPGYTGFRNSGGKKYWFKPQNGEWEIRGDGQKHHDKDISFFYMTFFEEKIEINCTFIEKTN